MTAGTDALKHAWRNNVTDGVPATGENKPDKAEIRTALDLLGVEIASSGSAILVYETQAELHANTTAPSGTLARVFGDSTATNNTYYQSSGSGTGAARWPVATDYIDALKGADGLLAAANHADMVAGTSGTDAATPAGLKGIGVVPGIQPALATWSAMSPTLTEVGFIYTQAGGNKVAATGWTSYTFDAAALAYYRVTAAILGTSTAMVVFFNGSTYISSINVGGAAVTFYDRELFQTPANCTKFVVSAVNTGGATVLVEAPTLKEQAGQEIDDLASKLDGTVDKLSYMVEQDLSGWIDGQFINKTTGVPAAGAGFSYVQLSVVPGQTGEWLAAINATNPCVLAFYTTTGGLISPTYGQGNGTFQSWLDYPDDLQPFTVPDNAAFLRFSTLTIYKDQSKLWIRTIADDLGEQLQGILAGSTDFRGTGTPIDAVAGSALLRVALNEDGWTGWAVQRKAGAWDTAVADHPEPAFGIHSFGQSNAGPNPIEPAVLTTSIFPRHVFVSAYGTSPGGALFGLSMSGSSGELDGTVYANADIIPGHDRSDGGIGSNPAITASFALAQIYRDQGLAFPCAHARGDYYGGQPLTTFLPGEVTYENLMKSIAGGVTAWARYGRDYQPCIIFNQGESGPTAGSGYQAMLEGLIDDLTEDVLTETGKLVTWLMWQISAISVSNTGVDLAQVAIAKARMGTRVGMIGPTYHVPTVDGVHQTVLGRMMQGELIALAQMHMRQQGWFTPLMPKAVTRDGAVITVEFWPTGNGLALDDDWVDATNIVNSGFSYSDDGTPPSITSVTITGRYTLDVTLSDTPTGANKKLRYAQVDASPAVANTWLERRGLLYSDSGHASPFARMGNILPPTIRHYCVGFEEGVA